MDEMKDKFKGFMKKMNTQLSSSSSTGKFKGQGRVLGSADPASSSSSSSSSSPSGAAVNPIYARYVSQQPVVNNHSKPNPKPSPSPSPSSSSSSTSKSSPQKSSVSDQTKPAPVSDSTPNRKAGNGFDPFDSLITTGKRSQNGYSLNVFECPICGQSFRSEEEVSVHLDSCVVDSSGSNIHSTNSGSVAAVDEGSDKIEDSSSRRSSELEGCLGIYLSGKPSVEGSVEVVLKLLKNVVKEPENAKFRRIRMGNPKIREAVTEVAGGVELLEFVGFQLKEEGGEMWAIMEAIPVEERISLINKVIGLLESRNMEQGGVLKAEEKPAPAPSAAEPVERRKIERQVKVFFSVPESVAAKIELPDSFYNLSLEELKREADMRKKKIAESQLLIPKSYKEKQAKAARKRYTRTIIRFQFPDGVVLQGIFAPWEPTSVLYEFVSTALKDPTLEFELLHPVVVKRRVIPHFPAPGERTITLDDEDLVPSALIKFRPIENDSSVFTGLCNELLEISEPLN